MQTILYYDEDDKMLWIQDGNNKYPVHTLANLTDKNTRLKGGEYLQVYDGTDWADVLDENGNPASLKGPQGKTGEDGNSVDPDLILTRLQEALASYHLELSNDMDQIYVDEAYMTFSQQTVQTSISLFKDSALEDNENGKWEYDILPNDSSFTQYCKIDENQNLICTIPTGVKLTNDNYIISVIARLLGVNGETVLRTITKDFKIKRIIGTTDYDLAVSPGYLKVSPDGTILSNVSVSIKTRSLKGPRLQSSYVTDLSQLPKEYSVYYSFGEGSDTLKPLNTNTIILKDTKVDINKETLPTLLVYLKYNNEVIDEAHLECIKDGKDGKTSYHIELSDDFNQIYTKDGTIAADQSYKVTITYFEGTDQQDINIQDLNIYINDDQLVNDGSKFVGQTNQISIIPNNTQDNKGVDLNITYKAGLNLTQITEQKIKIEIGAVSKTFTLLVLEGTEDFDLWISPDFISVYYDEQQDAYNTDVEKIEVKVTKRDIGTKSSAFEYIHTLPQNLSLNYKIDGRAGGPIAFNNQTGIINVDDNWIQEKNKKISISLDNATLGRAIDFSEVAILYDGKKGDKGDDGNSAYFLDLSNDYDQIYRHEGALIPNQSFTTNVYLYKGAEQVTIPDDATFKITNAQEVFGQESVRVDENGVGVITISFTDEQVSLNTNVNTLIYNLELEAVIDEQPIHLYKSIRISVLNGIVDYDLKVPSVFVKNGNKLLDGQEALPIIITEKRVDVKNASVTEHASELPQGLKLKYTIDAEDTENTLSILQLSTDILDKASSSIHLFLYDNQNVVRDYADINVVKNGTNGTNADLYEIRLTDASPIVLYLDPLTKKPIDGAHSRKLSFALYLNGNFKSDALLDGLIVSPETNQAFSDEIKKDGGDWEVTLNTNETYDQGNIIARVKCSYDNVEYSSTFNIEIKFASVVYDLIASPNSIHYNVNKDEFTPIELKVEREIRAGNFAKIDELTVAQIYASGITFSEDINGYDEQILYTSSADKIEFTPTKLNLTTIKCSANNALQDFVILPVVKDGKDGSVTELPDNPTIGQTVLYQGAGGADDKCAIGYLLPNVQYTYSILPKMASEKIPNKITDNYNAVHLLELLFTHPAIGNYVDVDDFINKITATNVDIDPALSACNLRYLKKPDENGAWIRREDQNALNKIQGIQPSLVNTIRGFGGYHHIATDLTYRSQVVIIKVKVGTNTKNPVENVYLDQNNKIEWPEMKDVLNLYAEAVKDTNGNYICSVVYDFLYPSNNKLISSGTYIAAVQLSWRYEDYQEAKDSEAVVLQGQEIKWGNQTQLVAWWPTGMQKFGDWDITKLFTLKTITLIPNQGVEI